MLATPIQCCTKLNPGKLSSFSLRTSIAHVIVCLLSRMTSTGVTCSDSLSPKNPSSSTHGAPLPNHPAHPISCVANAHHVPSHRIRTMICRVVLCAFTLSFVLDHECFSLPHSGRQIRSLCPPCPVIRLTVQLNVIQIDMNHETHPMIHLNLST